MPINGMGHFNVGKSVQLNAAAEQGSGTVKDTKKITKEVPIKAEPVDVNPDKFDPNNYDPGTVVHFTDEPANQTWMIVECDDGKLRARPIYPEGYVCGGQGIVGKK